MVVILIELPGPLEPGFGKMGEAVGNREFPPALLDLVKIGT